jgi:hypothetical protein
VESVSARCKRSIEARGVALAIPELVTVTVAAATSERKSFNGAPLREAIILPRMLREV